VARLDATPAPPAQGDVAAVERVHPYATDETYAAMLWFGAQRELALLVHRLAQRALERSRREGTPFVRGFAEGLRSHVEDGAPLQEGSIYAELLRVALAKVEWDELAYAILAGNDVS
jgi:hypothetical protein